MEKLTLSCDTFECFRYRLYAVELLASFPRKDAQNFVRPHRGRHRAAGWKEVDQLADLEFGHEAVPDHCCPGECSNGGVK